MKNIKLLIICLMIFLPLFFQGCDSCARIFSKGQKNQEVIEKKAAQFELTPELLAERARSGNYTYHSRLSFTLNNNGRKLINNELVNITATPSPQRLYMSKKIDGSHFLEIINNSNHFFVKSRTGDWRSGDRNKAQLEALMADALNVLSWLNEQCALQKLFVRHGKFLEITNKALPQNAPIITLLQITPSESLINGRIEVDKENIPVLANFTISMSKSPEFELKLELELSLAQNSSVSIPDLPVLAHDETLLYPVNIATRFKSLLDAPAQP